MSSRTRLRRVVLMNTEGGPAAVDEGTVLPPPVEKSDRHRPPALADEQEASADQDGPVRPVRRTKASGMAAKPKTKASKPKRERSPQPETTAPQRPAALLWLFRPRVLLLLAAGAAAVCFGPRWMGTLPDLGERPEYRLRTAAIEITPPPRWVPVDLVEQVIAESGLPDEVSLLDRDLTRAIAEAFGRHPWVAEVVRVRKSLPARVQVELRYREPVAMVEVTQGMYPVDADGTLLPPADFSVAAAGRYPTILNVTSAPQGPAGTAWGDVSVLGAARLAEILQRSDAGGETLWKKFHLVAIRVPNRLAGEGSIEDLALELISTGGSRILWGRPPGSGHPGELSAEQKIGRLEEYAARYEGFDRPHGPYEIDIRHWQIMTRRPLSAATGSARR